MLKPPAKKTGRVVLLFNAPGLFFLYCGQPNLTRHSHNIRRAQHRTLTTASRLTTSFVLFLSSPSHCNCTRQLHHCTAATLSCVFAQCIGALCCTFALAARAACHQQPRGEDQLRAVICCTTHHLRQLSISA